MNLKARLVKLAQEHPEKRALLVPLLRQAGTPSYRDYVEKKKKKQQTPLSKDEWERKVLQTGVSGEKLKKKKEEGETTGEKIHQGPGYAGKTFKAITDHVDKEVGKLLQSFPPFTRTDIRKHKTWKAVETAQNEISKYVRKGGEEGTDEYDKLVKKLDSAIAGAKKYMEAKKNVKTPEKSEAQKREEFIKNLKDPKDRERFRKMSPEEFAKAKAGMTEDEEEEGGKTASSLYGQVVRLARENPNGIRSHLVPILRQFEGRWRN
jgi:uncharacterized short protein YbdD (DUF466 family)